MKLRGILLLVTTVAITFNSAAAGAELSKELAILKPMVEKKWVGKIKALDGSGDLDIVREYKVILDGKAIRISNYCHELDNYQEGLIYWDASEKKIRLTTINNKGTSQNGFISSEDGQILVQGTISFVRESLEFKNYFEVLENGKIKDKWFSYEGNEWKAGHAVELTAEDTDESGQ